MIQNPNLVDVRPGDEIDGFYLLTDATVRTSANGSRYLSATLCDRSGSLDLKMWDYSQNIGPEDNGSAVRVRGQVLDYRGTKQLNVRLLRLAEEKDGVLAENLVPTAPIDAEEAMRYVESILAGLQDDDYRRLAETVFSTRTRCVMHGACMKRVPLLGSGSGASTLPYAGLESTKGSYSTVVVSPPFPS